MKVVVAGGTGFIGSAVVDRLLADQHTVAVLTRNASKFSHPGGTVTPVEWDGKTQGPWTSSLEGCDAVVSMTGESIGAKRWTKERKARILASRVEPTKALVDAIDQVKQRPKVFVSASAVGYYGDVPSGEVTEAHQKGSGFLADVTDEWEAEARKAESSGVRVVIPRSGVVLDRGSEALEKMELPFKLFAGGPIGSGRQWFPWIHREDVAGAILFCIGHEALRGPVNMVGPEPVTMKQFTKALGRALHRPSWAPAPAPILRLALGEMAEMILTGQKAIPSKLQEAGFQFRYPTLDGALAAIYGR